MSIYLYGCDPIPALNCKDCPPSSLGRIRGVWFQNRDFNFINIQNPTEWATAIANGDVIVVPYVNGSLTSSPKTEDSFGDVPEQVVCYEFGIEADIPMNMANDTIWNEINKVKTFRVGFVGQDYMGLSDSVAMIVFSQMVDQDKEKLVRDHLSIKFIQQNVVVRQARVSSIFDSCAG